MKCGHLFNGIGGFALAAHWMGWQNVWQSEIDEFCNKVMNKHFPESTQYGDIKETDWSKAEAVDLVTGGFPCQPFSTAGKQGGTEDDRYLWPEMHRSIKEVKPRWVVAENVDGILSWNEGMVLDAVLSDLENEGYEVQTYVLPAAGVNAPHRRYRVWIVAYSHSIGNDRMQGTEGGYNEGKQSTNKEQSRNGWASEIKRYGKGGDASNSELKRLERGIRMGQPVRPEQGGKKTSSYTAEEYDRETFRESETGRVQQSRKCAKQGVITDTEGINERNARLRKECVKGKDRGRGSGEAWFNRFPSTPPICRGNDGISNRVDRIKALGNAIVPQVAYQIFKAIEQFESLTPLTESK